MKVTFLSTGITILSFNLDMDNKKVTSLKVENEPVARIVLLQHDSVSYESFYELLKYYMGGNFTLEEYLNHIKEHFFYTPYQRNLDIVLEDK